MVGCRRGHASIKVVGIYKEAPADFLSVPTVSWPTSDSAHLVLPLFNPFRVHKAKRPGKPVATFNISRKRAARFVDAVAIKLPREPILTDTSFIKRANAADLLKRRGR